MPKKYMKDSCSPVVSHYGLCEMEIIFFSSKGEKKCILTLKKKKAKNYLFLNYVQSNSG